MNFESGFAQGSQEVDSSGLKRRQRLIAVVAIGLVLLIAVLFWATRKGDSSAADAGAEAAPRVTVVAPGSSDISAVINATGTLAARRQMPVGVVGEGGQVTAVLVDAGDWVRRGQVLARVERSVQTQQQASLAAQVQVARSDARLAQNNLERAQALVSRGFISNADLDSKVANRDAAVARVHVAEAQLRQQQASNGRLDIRAPADGLVLTRAVEPGQVVSAGSAALFQIAKDGQIEMLARVDEADLARLRVGETATVTPVGGTTSYEGRIWQVAPVIDPQTRQGNARILLPYHKDLRPGGFAAARIVSGSADVPVLPESAIQNDDKGSYVYIVNADNVVQRRDVTVGQVSAAGVTVSSGLTGRERVVTLAGGFLNPGQKVVPEMQKDRRR